MAYTLYTRTYGTPGAPLTNVQIDANFQNIHDNAESRWLTSDVSELNVGGKVVLRNSAGDIFVEQVNAASLDVTGALQVVGGAQILETLWVGSGTAASPGTSGYISLTANTTESSITVKAGTTTGDTDAILYLDATDTGECAVYFKDQGVDLFQIGTLDGDLSNFYVGKVLAASNIGFRLSTTDAYCFTGLTVAGRYVQPVDAVAALDINCTLGNYFTKTVSAPTTFTFSNPPTTGNVYAFTLEITHISGAITWPTSVKWNDNSAPILTTMKAHLFTFVTTDGGTTWRGSALVNFAA